ncbi:MAG: efflux RND transporter periplasmic adaptor subunit [Cyanophyceae cyanobacterium]
MNRNRFPDEEASKQAEKAIDPKKLPNDGAEKRLLVPLNGNVSSKKLNRQWLLWGIGFLCGLAGQWSLHWLPSVSLNRQVSKTAPAQMPPSSQAVFVETTAIQPVDSYREARTYTGTLVARRSSELGFERTGQLKRIFVDEGDRVQVGMSLALLDTQELEAERQKLLAQRAQAVAQMQEMERGPRQETISAAQAVVRDINEQLKLARLKSQRRENLYAEGAIAREQLDQAAYEASALQARLDEAQSHLNQLKTGTRSEQIDAQQAVIAQIDASLAQLEIEQENSLLKAPFSGTIAVRHVDEGRVVAASQPIVRLVESNHLEAQVSLPVREAEALKAGSDQSLIINQTRYQAKVSSILPEVDSSTATVTAVLALDPTAAAVVRPGQAVALEWSDTVTESGYWVPVTALVKGERGLWSCYVLGEPIPSDENGPTFRIERRAVEILHTESDVSGGDKAVRAFVRGTLQSGDRVIASGIHRLIPGQIVRSSGLKNDRL